MAEKKTNNNGVVGEDYIVLTPKANATTILPWGLRLINNIGQSIHIDFRHTNLMTKEIYISIEEEERNDKNTKIEEKILERTGVKL